MIRTFRPLQTGLLDKWMDLPPLRAPLFSASFADDSSLLTHILIDWWKMLTLRSQDFKVVKGRTRLFRRFKYRDTYVPNNQQLNWLSFSVPFENVSNMLARAKPIAVKRIQLNFRMIKQVFRRTVTYYRGADAARHLGFKSLNTVINLIWNARAMPFGPDLADAVAVHRNSGIEVDSNKCMTLENLADVLVHEALHYWATVRKRFLGSCLDHLCMQELGETTQPDATLKMIRRKYGQLIL